MRLLIRWVILAGAVLASSYICKLFGLKFEASAEDAAGFFRLLIGTAILALLNSTVGPILKLLTLPLNCLTFGLFSLVINAFVLILAASFEFGFKFTSEGTDRFLAAIVASLMIAVISGILNGILAPEKDKDDD